MRTFCQVVWLTAQVGKGRLGKNREVTSDVVASFAGRGTIEGGEEKERDTGTRGRRVHDSVPTSNRIQVQKK